MDWLTSICLAGGASVGVLMLLLKISPSRWVSSRAYFPSLFIISFVVAPIVFSIWFHSIDFSTSTSNSSSGYSSKKDYSDDSDWGNYDYDNDGQINQGEWEGALGDYMDSVMP